jgi:hypothetical protein
VPLSPHSAIMYLGDESALSAVRQPQTMPTFAGYFREVFGRELFVTLA